MHVQPASPHEAEGYFQEPVTGDSLSLLFLADGRSFQAVGFSWQWVAGSDKHPYRYGGAVRPAELQAEMQDDIKSAIGRLVKVTGLWGLNSADFIIGEKWWLIEINPRPGATLDVFDHPQLFAAHVAACQGQLPAQPFHFSGAKAAAVVYADVAIASCPAIAWPDWAADRQAPGSSLDAGDPLCKVIAEAASAAEAQRLVAARESAIKRMLRGDKT
jgi:predicted ATP-grasp superfamily ATP-dependent carboligase